MNTLEKEKWPHCSRTGRADPRGTRYEHSPPSANQAYLRHARPGDGYRILVDRIWPRGLTKQLAVVDLWLKDIAPSPQLRVWFGHDPEQWQAFRERYFQELRGNVKAVSRLTDLASASTVTLLFGAHDAERNNAAALSEYLASL
jgi:uncharacterized protein YeaO (DUF488 family)